MGVLHDACLEGRYEVVVKIIEKGANLELRDSDGSTPFLQACQSDVENVKLLEFMAEKGTNLFALEDDGDDAFRLAALEGKTKTCKFLIKNGFDLNRRNVNGFTPIMAACQAGHLETAQELH